MKKILKRGLSLALTLIMVVGLLPVSASAKVDNNTGYPLDLANDLILSIYTKDGEFPGEPALHSSNNYVSFNSKFEISSQKYASTAANELDWEKIEPALVEGTPNSDTVVWGVYDAEGTKNYFLPGANITKEANELKMIKAVFNRLGKTDNPEDYEIVWYIIKIQHTASRYSWWSTTEWHIDGIIKEKAKVSINYYGNGNTGGAAPNGITNHDPEKPYTVQGNTGNLVRVESNGNAAFMGWNTKADGSGEMYQAGDTIPTTEFAKHHNNISLYAMWNTNVQYTATVKTYLDGVLTDDSDIHGDARVLYLGADGKYHQLERTSEGVYTTSTGNGKYHLYNKVGSTYTQAGTRQLTIYNQNGSIDVHHYSVTYDPNDGDFAEKPGKQVYYYGEAVTAINNVPTREGYRFLGWNTKADGSGTMIQSGAEVTASITETIVLYAQWEKTVNVTINVTIDHNGGDGYDRVPTKGDVTLDLVSRENGSPYLEVEGGSLELGNSNTPEEQKETTYHYTFENMPGGAVEYSVVTSKSGYDTEVTEKKVNGNWVIDVKMKYRPTNFDVAFTVEVNKESVPEEYYPQAAIVKVTYWSRVGDGEWKIITQQDDNLPGVRVNLTEGKGTGSYPVWKYESNGEIPYGNRIEVTSFVYPDGTIVRANQEVTPDVAWSDGVYTATVQDVNSGKTYGSLEGAYYDKDSNSQKGTLKAVITMKLYDVIFKAQGGKVNGKDSETVTKQYKIPAFKDHVPTRGDGYTFGGWYLDKNYETPATEGTVLTGDTTLYAKWIEPLTIKGDIKILGKYELNGEDVPVNDVDRAKEAVVVLQEKRNGSYYEVDTQTVTFTYGADNNGTAPYSFSKIPNEGKEYRIQLLLLNYTTAYDNESADDEKYTLEECVAEFGGNNEAKVDALLTFVPPSYDQPLLVKAENFGADEYIPNTVLSKVTYRDTGDIHPFQVISQHRDSEDLGVNISLNKGEGEGTGTESIWKWHTDGTLYEYQMSITKVNDKDYDSDTAPFYIVYGEPAYWDGNTNKYSGNLIATLYPKAYPVIFDLNEGTGMEQFKLQDSGSEEVVYAYEKGHTWSHVTTITDALPRREGYVFKGWETTVSGVTSDTAGNVTIPANVQEEVVLKAKWEKKTYTVTTGSDPAGVSTTTGDGTYEHGDMVTVTATPAAGYTFDGWYEGSGYITNTLKYEFVANTDRNLTAKFTKNKYQITASSHNETHGSASGSGSYEEGATATVTATAKDGYKFLYWKEGDEQVSSEATYSFSVNRNRELVAHFGAAYKITAIAENGGTAEGTGWYFANDSVTIIAKPDSKHNFIGWYENGKFVSDKAEYTLENPITGNRTFTAKFKEKVALKCDYVYLFGYNDSEIGATGSLLRNELSQMIYRLVKQNDLSITPGGYSNSNTADQWFESGISYMVTVGALNDAKANSPYVSVTCGETYKMICLGLKFTDDQNLDYSEYAAILRNYDLPADGSVTAPIKRWQFCKLFNAILGRSDYELVDAAGNEITPDTYGYTDLSKEDDYYRIMMIATSAFEGEKVSLEKRIERNAYDYDGE